MHQPSLSALSRLTRITRRRCAPHHLRGAGRRAGLAACLLLLSLSSFPAQPTGRVGGALADDRPRARRLFNISGRVTHNGKGVADVTVTLSGIDRVTTTDTDGNYLFVKLPGGSDLTIVPSRPSYEFNPPSHTLFALSTDQEGIDFVAIPPRGIRGRVTDEEEKPIPDLVITLINDWGNFTRETLTDSDGDYSFDDIPNGYSYTIVPAENPIFAFTPQITDPLEEGQTLDFRGDRYLYSVRGRVTQDGLGLSGVSVLLEGADRYTTTDRTGRYSFQRVPAGFDYTVVPSKVDHYFEPFRQTFNRLDRQQLADFQARLGLIVSGRITDASGQGVFGINVSLSGGQTDTTRTSSDGTYAFALAGHGSYTLTPSKEQDFYTFTPASRTVVTTAGDRFADFSAALETSVIPSYVLQFDGSPKTVDYSVPKPVIVTGDDYNLFWPEGVDLGHFFWELWAMPGQNAGATYMVSDGYGGAHALLFGMSDLNGYEFGRYRLLGNVWNTSTNVFFGSDDGPAQNEWGHFAVGWDGQWIVTYLNGVPVGRAAFTGPRRTPGGLQGGGRLLVGGSDHNNFVGRIAQIRGFEGRNPRAEGASSAFIPYAPQTVFGVDGNVLSYYFKQSDSIADLSPGYNNKTHPGLRRSTINGVPQQCPICPLPEFVLDPSAPDFAHPADPGLPPAPIVNPPPAPAGARIFDSFTRRNATLVFDGRGGLGSTEGGTTGPQSWQTTAGPTQRQPFGILNTRAVVLTDATALAWVPGVPGASNHDIRVERKPGTWGTGQNTGLAFRVVDNANYFFAYTSEHPGGQTLPKTLTVGYYRDGVRTVLASGLSMTGGWSILRVVTNTAGEIKVYANFTLVYSTVNTLFAGTPGAGLYNNAPGLALTNRWDNFTVYVGP